MELWDPVTPTDHLSITVRNHFMKGDIFIKGMLLIIMTLLQSVGTISKQFIKVIGLFNPRHP